MKKIEDLKIKIFADGADKKEMIDVSSKTFIKGLTTNPSLMKKRVLKITSHLQKIFFQQLRKNQFHLKFF